jgi:heme O synthase-like polyprenyltransferase
LKIIEELEIRNPPKKNKKKLIHLQLHWLRDNPYPNPEESDTNRESLNFNNSKYIFDFLYFKLNIYFELLKFRLSLLVSLSSGFGYGLSLNQCNCKWINFFLFFLGGFLISSSSIIFNQILEKNYDKFMFRTNNRPLPKNKISTFESFFFSIFILIFGSILLLYYTNFLTFYLSLFSLFLYNFITERNKTIRNR